MVLLALAGVAGAWAGGVLPSGAVASVLAGGVGPRAVDVLAPGEERASGQRLLPAPAVPAGPGSYAFSNVLEDGRSPVGWDPCRPMRYVVRPAGEVPGGAALLSSAVNAVSEATGLSVVDAGATDEDPSSTREPYQPKRYGLGWAPVLVAWSNPVESPELAGDVAGFAGPVGYARPGQRQRYVSGQVVLDAPQLTQMLARPGGADRVRAAVLHELGHLVGLAHVSDPSQLMNPTSGPAAPIGYAPGDLRGLALLGGGGCR